MLIDFGRYLLGYMDVKIRGNEKQRFINMAVRKGINFWDYRGHPEGEEYRVKVNFFREKELTEIARKTGVKLEFSGRKGLPLRLRFLKSHPGLLAGLLLAVISIITLSDNIWVLTTSGSSVYSDEEVFAAAEELGICLGADYDDFDAINAGRLLMLKLPEISWVSINNDGVVTDIALKDREPTPEMEEKATGIWNVVAGRTGVIHSVEAWEGIPQVQAGDVGKTGDMCISGIWEDKYGRTLTAPSRGKVIAQVQENFWVTVPKKKILYDDIETVTKRELQVFGLRIPLSLSFEDFELRRVENSEKKLTVLSMELPLVYRETKITRLQANVVFLSQEEQEQAALRKLETYQQAFMGEEGELLRQENEICFNDEGCSIESRSFFLIDIAVPREVLVDERILANQYKTE